MPQGRTLACAALSALLGILGCNHRAQPEAKSDLRVTLKSAKGVKFKLGAGFAVSYGIEATPAKAVTWQPRLFVDGRVVANPQATLEVRAPFAGIVLSDPDVPFPRLGDPVEPRKRLARFEARVNPLEKLDLHTKLAAAEASYKGALEFLDIRQKRVKLLEGLPTGAISQSNRDEAAILLVEAKTALQIAQTQRDLYKEALESAGKKSVIVPVAAPMGGEVAEIAALPGANVTEGQLLLRIVDFRRVLVRLDCPDLLPPESLEVESLGASIPWRMYRRGPAPNVEIGLQKTGWLYEVVPSDAPAAPNWRPGLYVKASIPDSTRKPLPAVALPASALLIHQGHMLVYVELSPGRYERRVLGADDLLGREQDMIYVANVVRADERVVFQHAQVLLSEEFRSDVDDD